MTTAIDLVQIDATTHVRRGTGKAGWKNYRGKSLLVVSAEMPDGQRADVDSSACPFLALGLLEQING